MFKVGDKVVYPHHGAGTVVKKEKRVVLGEKREYLTIKILHNDMTVNVPCENAEAVGLRQVIDEEMVKKVTKALTGGGTAMPKNWNRRFKHNRDKMKTGDIFELAEVVRNLSLRDHEKGLSTGEKQMFVKAKKILASELMYAKALDEEAAAAWLDEVSHDERQRRYEEEDDDDDGEDCGGVEVPEQGRRGGVEPACRSGPSLLRQGAASGSAASARRPSSGSATYPLLAEPLRRLDESDWIDWIVVAAPPGWEEPASSWRRSSASARWPPCVTGGRHARGFGACRRSRRSLTTPPWCSCTTRPGRSSPTTVIGRVLAPLSEGWDGAVPALPGRDTIKRVRDGEVVETIDAGRARRRADAAGVSRRRACGVRRERRGRPTAPALVEAAAAGSRSSRAIRGS